MTKREKILVQWWEYLRQYREEYFEIVVDDSAWQADTKVIEVLERGSQ